MNKASIIIHGGCGRFEAKNVRYEKYRKHLRDIIGSARKLLLDGAGAREVAIHAIKMLENDTLFNAGIGSKIQADGIIRMTAAVIDSKTQTFSGVMNIQDVKNPIEVADLLSNESHNVLAGIPALEFARSKNVPYFNPVTALRLKEFNDNVTGKTGTVGAVVLDKKGVICSATSTGGIGGELPGRVSDSATVAGTYCSKECGVSATGMGEHIIRMAVAARFVTMAEEGRSLEKAKTLIVNQANNKKLRFGFIALDREGNWVAGQTRKVKTIFAVCDSDNIITF